MKTIRTVLGVLIFVLAARSSSALQFVTPAAQAVMRSGSVITITIAPSDGEVLQAVSVGTFDETADAVAGPQPGTFVAQLHVPLKAVGTFFVVAMANADSGLDVEYTKLVADPGPLTRLVVTAPSVLGTIGQVADVAVQGVFADGVVRDLTSSSRGTTYATTNDTVLGADPAGLIQARTRGTVQLVVTNKHVVTGLTTTAAVTVQCDLPNPLTNRIPVADAGSDATVPTQTITYLDGSASFDPDGDAITYEWRQEAGRAVVLRDPSTSSPAFISPNVSEPEVLQFSLVITDSKGATTLPKIVRVTVQP